MLVLLYTQGRTEQHVLQHTKKALSVSCTATNNCKNGTVCSLGICIYTFQQVMFLCSMHNVSMSCCALGFVHHTHMASAAWHRALAIPFLKILHHFLMSGTDTDFWTGRLEQEAWIWTMHMWVSLFTRYIPCYQLRILHSLPGGCSIPTHMVLGRYFSCQLPFHFRIIELFRLGNTFKINLSSLL